MQLNMLLYLQNLVTVSNIGHTCWKIQEGLYYAFYKLLRQKIIFLSAYTPYNFEQDFFLFGPQFPHM